MMDNRKISAAFSIALVVAQCIVSDVFAETFGGRLDELVGLARECTPLQERKAWSALETIEGCLELVGIYESNGSSAAYDAAVATGWDIACENGYIAGGETSEKWKSLCRKLREITGDSRWDDPRIKAERRLADPGMRLDRSGFIVGAYGFGGIKKIEERHVRDLAECGVNLVSIGGLQVSIESSGKRRDEILDWCLKYGIKCTLGWQLPGDWGWNGGDPKKRYAKGERWAKCDMNRFDAYTARFRDHPAIAMISTCDEPSALDYPFRAKFTRRVMRNFPNQVPFFNLFPNYALPDDAGNERAVQQLGAKDYEQYVAGYFKYIPLDYISYDFYPWAWNVTFRKFYDNLRVVADACSGTEKSHWLYLQCTRYNQDKKERYPVMDEPRLRYQAATALAYGAECIIWACWAPSWGGWDINAVDADGNPTVVYEPLKKVNLALRSLSPEYMKYRRMTTDLVGVPGELSESSGTAFRNVKATDGAALAVGHFAARSGNGNYAIFIAALDDPNGRNVTTHTVTFAMPRKGFKIRAVDGSGPVAVTTAEDGTMSVPLTTCHGVLVIGERE